MRGINCNKGWRAQHLLVGLVQQHELHALPLVLRDSGQVIDLDALLGDLFEQKVHAAVVHVDVHDAVTATVEQSPGVVHRHPARTHRVCTCQRMVGRAMSGQ